MKLLDRIKKEDYSAYNRFCAEKGADNTSSIRAFYADWKRVKDGLAE